MAKFTPFTMLKLLWRPRAVFETIADTEPCSRSVFLGTSLWLGLAPPVFALVGASRFGWQIGGVEPLLLSTQELLIISTGYFAALLAGFVSAALISRWMASTYGARRSLGAHFALITVVGAPLAFGSVIHLHPHLVTNLIILVPALIWSLYLLYWGLPIALNVSPERGMLMASSLVAFFLVAGVSLLGFTVVLWSYGIGPRLWI